MSDTTPIQTFKDAEARLAETLPRYESRPQQQLLAAAVEAAIATGRNLIGQAGCGCIYGDAEIVVSRGGGAVTRKLSLLVDKFNGGGGRYAWDLSIPTYVQREADDGTVRRALLKAAWFSGEKQTYTVTTESGRTIRATDEHPFLTERGWLRLDGLVSGDLVHVRGERSSRGRQSKPRYHRVSRMQYHSFANHYNRGSAIVPEHRLVAEADRNDLSYEDFVVRVIAGDVDGLEFLDPAVWTVHHDDEDVSNNTLSNLRVMTHADHHRLHANRGDTANVQIMVAIEKVESVALYGVEPTYDIEVDDDPHNFIANGFVVHNTGKSLGYIIPAAIAAALDGKRTIISTATKSLQDQIANLDLPFIQANLGVPFTSAVLKGRSNYLCGPKAMAADGVTSLGRILERAGEADFDGERLSLGFEISDADWMKVAADTDDCQSLGCKDLGGCFAHLARERAKVADIVVVNHALYFTNLMVEQNTFGNSSLLDQHDVVIFDEAHEIEEYASGVIGSRLTASSLRFLVVEVRNWTHKVDGDSGAALEAALLMQEAADALWAKLEPGRIRQETLLVAEEEWVLLAQRLQELHEAVTAVSLELVEGTEVAKLRKTKQRLQGRVLSASRKFVDLIVTDFADLVRWVEEDIDLKGNKFLTIKSSPVNVGTYLRDWLFEAEGGPVAILTSATILVDGSASYISGRLGIDTFDHLDVGTPFDFDSQARLYLDAKLPDPTKEKAAWTSVAIARMGELVRASDGRALLLFTSTAMMRNAWDMLADTLPYTCLIQGRGTSNKDLAAEFLSDTHSVLFATRSFFTGVDFQGEALSLVVIDKLPFPVPTEPLTEARCEAIRARGGSDFREYTIPVMTLVLEQGFGRLIRHRDDRGVVAILDPRLLTKPYGKIILRSLPEARRVITVAEVAEVFSKVSG